MATQSSSSSQGSTTRLQADPLPTKRGEIGYRESLNPPVSSDAGLQSNVTAQHTPIPARHPADRDPQPGSSQSAPPPIANANGNLPATGSQPSECNPIFAIFKPQFNRCGVRTSTVFLLVTQGAFLLITISLWVIVTKLILPSSSIGREMVTGVLVHTGFITGTFCQAVFLERLVFRYRAERYAMLHPGEALPDHFHRGEQISTRLALAPWNRPPLPTYAAVLMESGAGTGDVEDNHIAVLPPPAYGHTRGSTLILAGFIGSELQEQSRRAREARGERVSQATVASIESIKSSIKSWPLSYVTVDSEWDARCDMSRATYLAETLAQLEAEEGDLATVRVVSPAPSQTGFVNPGPPKPSPRSPSPLA